MEQNKTKSSYTLY